MKPITGTTKIAKIEASLVIKHLAAYQETGYQLGQIIDD